MEGSSAHNSRSPPDWTGFVFRFDRCWHLEHKQLGAGLRGRRRTNEGICVMIYSPKKHTALYLSHTSITFPRKKSKKAFENIVYTGQSTKTQSIYIVPISGFGLSDHLPRVNVWWYTSPKTANERCFILVILRLPSLAKKAKKHLRTSFAVNNLRGYKVPARSR